MADNFTRYKEALKARYHEIKHLDHSDFLLEISWARLRNLCSEVYTENDNMDDCRTFELFLGFKPNESTKKKMIDQTDKFRPLVTFLKNETELSDKVGADLLAVLLDYKYRPFNKFKTLEEHELEVIKSNQDVLGEDVRIKTPKASEENVSQEKNKSTVNEEGRTNDEEKRRKRKNVLFVLLLIFIITVLGFISYATFFPERKCLQWQSDHYEMVSCDEKMEIGRNGIEACSDALLHFRKITPDSTIEPFKNGKPNLWTGRGLSGAIEYFNSPGTGKHPVTYVALKPITHGRAVKLVEQYHK